MKTKQRVIRKRNDNAGSESRVAKLSLRMTRQMSNRLASIQGLVRAFGKGESLADLFERAAMPAIQAYVAPYAERARAFREAERQARLSAPAVAAT